MDTILISGSQISTRLWCYLPLLGSHFTVLFSQTDPLQIAQPGQTDNLDSKKSWHIRCHFLLGFLNTAAICLFGTLGMQLWDNDGQVDWVGIRDGTTPHMFTHQSFPQVLWPQIDIGMGIIDCGFTAAVLLADFLNRMVPAKYMMVYQPELGVISIDGRILPLGDVASILQTSSRMRIILLMVIPVFYVLGAGIYEVTFWFTIDQYTPARMIYWSVLFPLFFVYIVYAVFARVTYVILASAYLRIQQKTIQAQLQVIIKRLEMISHSSRQHSLQQNAQAATRMPSIRQKKALFMNYQHYRAINDATVGVCRQTRAYARYCNPILSTVLPFYITLQGYMIIIALFIKDTPFIFSMVLMFYTLIVNWFLFYIIRQCAGVVKHNKRLQRGMFRFFQLYERLGGFRLSSHGIMLKAEACHDSRRFREYSFRLIGDYRITQQTYSLIISYISIFLMYLYKEDVNKSSIEKN